MNNLKVIKAELERINGDINLQGGIKSVVIKDLVKALSVAVESMQYVEPWVRWEYNDEIPDALKSIAEILSGEGQIK